MACLFLNIFSFNSIIMDFCCHYMLFKVPIENLIIWLTDYFPKNDDFANSTMWCTLIYHMYSLASYLCHWQALSNESIHYLLTPWPVYFPMLLHFILELLGCVMSYYITYKCENTYTVLIIWKYLTLETTNYKKYLKTEKKDSI